MEAREWSDLGQQERSSEKQPLGALWLIPSRYPGPTWLASRQDTHLTPQPCNVLPGCPFSSGNAYPSVHISNLGALGNPNDLRESWHSLSLESSSTWLPLYHSTFKCPVISGLHHISKEPSTPCRQRLCSADHYRQTWNGGFN